MASFIEKFKMSPFISQPQGASAQPIRQAVPQEPGIGFGGNPFAKAASNTNPFAHIARQEGPGSFLQAAPGEMGLGDRAIQQGNNTLGKKLFISV